MFVRVIHEALIKEIPFLIFLSIILSHVSTRISIFNFLVPVFFNSFTNEFIIGFANDVFPDAIGGPNKLCQPNRNPPNCMISDNSGFFWKFYISW